MRTPYYSNTPASLALLALMSLIPHGAFASSTPPGPGTTMPPRPDLTILEMKPVYHKVGQFWVRDQDTVWAKIANTGTTHAGGFGMRFQWAQGYGDQVWYYYFPSGLAAGNSFWTKVSSQGYDLYAAGHYAQLMIDHNYAIAESNETNNVYNYP